MGCLTFVVLAAMCLCRCTCTSCSQGSKHEKDSINELTHRVHLNDTLTNDMSAQPELQPMDSIMRRYLKRWEINGAQLAITRHDSLIYARGFGYSDKDRQIPMQPSVIMRMASCSKLVTAVGIMKLRDMGKIRLSDKVFGPQGILRDTFYTSSIKDKRYLDITVEQLLRHKAGFTNYAGDAIFSTRYIMQQNHLTTPPEHCCASTSNVTLATRLAPHSATATSDIHCCHSSYRPKPACHTRGSCKSMFSSLPAATTST